MLHTKFRENPPAGSGEDFLRVFTIYGRGGHLGHVTQMPRKKFSYPYPRRLQIIFGWFLRRRCFQEHCGRRRRRTTTDDVRRTPDHGYIL